MPAFTKNGGFFGYNKYEPTFKAEPKFNRTISVDQMKAQLNNTFYPDYSK
jgi:hypothetical protein